MSSTPPMTCFAVSNRRLIQWSIVEFLAARGLEACSALSNDSAVALLQERSLDLVTADRTKLAYSARSKSRRCWTLAATTSNVSAPHGSVPPPDRQSPPIRSVDPDVLHQAGTLLSLQHPWSGACIVLRHAVALRLGPHRAREQRLDLCQVRPTAEVSHQSQPWNGKVGRSRVG